MTKSWPLLFLCLALLKKFSQSIFLIFSISLFVGEIHADILMPSDKPKLPSPGIQRENPKDVQKNLKDSAASNSAKSAVPDFSKTLIVIGDSLTEGYGVSREASFVSLLEKKMNASGKKWKVINAGISGSTSASALTRMKWQLRAKPDIILLALGGNDALRGLKPEETEKNLAEAIELAQKDKYEVILAGMMAPPNYGKDYTDKFKALYPKLQKKFNLKLIPFLLEGVAGNSKMNQMDGIHPNEEGHAVISENIYKSLKGIL